MLIEKLHLDRNALLGKIILITGAGGGIGFEAARAFAYLGAEIIIAEIDAEKGMQAQEKINHELHSEQVFFYKVDISDEKQIDDLYGFIKNKYEFVDVVFNNATVTPIGAVDKLSVLEWDKSYTVNLRAPVLLAQKFLPDMKKNNSGVIVFVPSSGAAPYMGAYEVFKTSQVELCNTLSGELEETNIYTYAIGPGLVRTETAERAIEKVSHLMGMTTNEFYQINDKHMLDAEEAGLGFALSVVNAKRYNGQEIGSIQALMDAGFFEKQTQTEVSTISLNDMGSLSEQIEDIVRVFDEQYDGWLTRSIFERQWVLRDFKKTVGTAADAFRKNMVSILELAKRQRLTAEYKSEFEKLKTYYLHQYKLLQGYEKNPEMLKKNSQAILGWIDDLQAVINIFENCIVVE